jgi:hypothetical protein
MTEKPESSSLEKPRRQSFYFGLTLQEALFLGFCATFIVITRVVLRLHLKIPGHAMLFTMFFLILGRACVPKKGAGTVIGLVAGCMSMLIGMGKGGPLGILKFLLPGIVVDLGAKLFPVLGTSYVATILVGIVASATRIVSQMVVEWIIGMEHALIIQHAVISSTAGMVFGGVGAALVPPIAKRLRLHGLIR